MVEVFYKVGFLKGFVNVVIGCGFVIGDYLVEYEGINMVLFIGGINIGKYLVKKVLMILFVLEFGGKDFGIVCEDVDL